VEGADDEDLFVRDPANMAKVEDYFGGMKDVGKGGETVALLPGMELGRKMERSFQSFKFHFPHCGHPLPAGAPTPTREIGQTTGMTRILAAADIGSNTAHLLVAATDGSLVMRIDNYNEWIPLGEVVAKQGSIPKEMVQQLILAIKEFKRTSTAKSAEALYVFATEGMRMARNHAQVLEKIATETGVKVEVISPQREAELSMRGVGLDTRNLGADMLFEVGGGSLQIGRIERNGLLEKASLPLGTGRIIAESGLRSPCPEWALNAAVSYIEATLAVSPIGGSAKMPVASGGVGRGLWRALHPDGEKVLHLEEIEYMVWASAHLPVDRIVSRFGVKQKRAGTLLPGALVYQALLRKYGATQMAISEFGIREGAILEMASTRSGGAK